MRDFRRVRPRRLLRFSLRGLLILITVASIWLAYEVNLAHRQRDAIASLSDSLAWVKYNPRFGNDGEPPYGNWSNDYVANVAPTWADAFDANHFLLRIDDLHLLVDKTNDETIAVAAELPNLRRISNNHAWMGSRPGTLAIERIPRDAEDVAITDAACTRLANAEELEAIVLINTRITMAGLRCLLTLPDLRELAIASARIDDDAVSTLAEMTSLTFLHLGGTNITDDGVRRLRAALPDCRIYDRNGSATDDI